MNYLEEKQVCSCIFVLGKNVEEEETDVLAGGGTKGINEDGCLMGGVRHKPDPSVSDSMAFVGVLHISFLFLLHQVHSEDPEPTFKAVGSTIEWGYCFKMDYIVLYKCGPEGDQLLGNSSGDNQPITPPADLHGRIHINNNHELLGLQIRQLTYLDSGVYRTECWKNQTRVSHRSQQLFMCGEEVEVEMFTANERGGQTELLCNHTSTGTSVRWYYNIEQSSRFQLFLDTSVSLKPLVDELQGVVKVKHNGTLLLLNNTLLKQKQEFYCLITNGEECLSFQNMYKPVDSEMKIIFASAGDKVELNCPFESEKQQWYTPLGNINSSSVRSDRMYIQSDTPGQYSLVIPVVSDEHSGEYSCVSATLQLEYSLYLCPQRKPKEKEFTDGGSITLECNVDQVDSKTVLWFRQESAGENKLIFDSNDETAAIPEDLRGRMSLSKNGFALMLSNVDQKDGGSYQCVALERTDSLEYDYDYTDDYDDEEQYLNYERPRCFFKQEIKVILAGKSLSISEFAIAAIVIVIVIVALGLAVAVIVIRMRAKASRKQESGSKQRTNKDIKMSVDPECMEKLNPV
ncbi:uncharacterized protein LOC129181549 [Dunckerocampus dactyliophorus]|uniref:uncharacterized protein LOC129181549 n=1 Tax=Dunckerocampus dactyliophorus TaxID=161453 RepID=UPI002406DB18|nr:uncharacterized protein LOC129181549 [Dunckerocampus dactyliophorus]